MPWTSLSATPPVLRRIRSLSAAGDYVYIVGGIDINWDGMNRFDRYNVQTGLWVALTAPGMEIGEPAQVATSTELFIFCGTGYGSGNNKKYNFSTQQWSDIGNPTYRCDGAAVAWDGADTIYLLGGWRGSNYQQYVYAYSITNNTYTAKTNLPARRGCGAAFIHDNYLYYVGGENTTSPQSTVYRLQLPDDTTWSTMTPVPTACSAPASVWRGDMGKFYLFCGLTTSGVTDVVRTYDPAADQWSTLISAPAARYECAAAVGSDGKAYLFGGTDSSEALFATDWQYTFGTGSQDSVITAVVSTAAAGINLPAVAVWTTIDAGVTSAILEASAAAYTPTVLVLADITVYATKVDASAGAGIPAIATSTVVDLFVTAGVCALTAEVLPPGVKATSYVQNSLRWQIRDFGRADGIYVSVGPSEYRRTRQADVVYEQLLDGGYSPINTPKIFAKEEYQIVWANVDRSQLETMKGFINKKVEITDHLFETSVGYADSVSWQHLLSGSSEERYAVSVKIKKA
jgi:hypothetical protein